MKKKTTLFAVILIAGLAAGCSQTQQEMDLSGTEETEQIQESEVQDGETVPEGQAGDKVSAEGFSFADVADREFYFSSGAGAWYTVLYIHEDGSFDGHYEDTNLGDMGDNYNGTIYYSDFTGQFTEPEKVDDTTYRFRIQSIEYPLGFGEEIKDGVRYSYTGEYGLDGAEELYMYLPGSELADLPESFLTWVGYYNPESTEETNLPFYGLYNEKMDQGFSSYVRDDVVPETEDWAQQIKAEAEAAEAGAPMDTQLIYDGRYFDESIYLYWVGEITDASSLTYCEILIRNVTDTSFDFTVNELAAETDEGPEILSGTARIQDNGKAAVYEGEEFTLTFHFESAPEVFPKYFTVEGWDKLEGKTYMNNNIPGHESG